MSGGKQARRVGRQANVTQRQAVRIATDQYASGFACAIDAVCAILDLGAQSAPEARAEADLLILIFREIERATIASYPAALEEHKAWRAAQSVVIRPRAQIEADLTLRQQVSEQAMAIARAAITTLFSNQVSNQDGRG